MSQPATDAITIQPVSAANAPEINMLYPTAPNPETGEMVNTALPQAALQSNVITTQPLITSADKQNPNEEFSQFQPRVTQPEVKEVVEDSWCTTCLDALDCAVVCGECCCACCSDSPIDTVADGGDVQDYVDCCSAMCDCCSD